jgi:hypothetical protein
VPGEIRTRLLTHGSGSTPYSIADLLDGLHDAIVASSAAVLEAQREEERQAEKSGAAAAYRESVRQIRHGMGIGGAG